MQVLARPRIQGENWSEQRHAAFRSAVAPTPVNAYELPRNAVDRRSWERVENKLARWVAGLPKPIGILVCSDQRGAQLLEACRRANVVVPDEVAVIGVDNDEPLCEVCDPPLSSIKAGHVSVGYEAASLLDRLLHRSAPTARRPQLVPPEHVIARMSTDTLAIDDPAVATALRLIRERGYLALDVNEVARRVNLSRSVLQRRFRVLLNRTVHQEIVAAKIKRAEDLLANTDMPLSVIAERSGFRHQEYMGAVFKKMLGKTPATARRRSRRS